MGDWLDELYDDEDIEIDETEYIFEDDEDEYCMCDLCQGNCPDLEDEDE